MGTLVRPPYYGGGVWGKSIQKIRISVYILINIMFVTGPQVHEPEILTKPWPRLYRPRDIVFNCSAICLRISSHIHDIPSTSLKKWFPRWPSAFLFSAHKVGRVWRHHRCPSIWLFGGYLGSPWRISFILHTHIRRGVDVSFGGYDD